jgi:outer membrane cobalamin receptor
VVATTPLQGSGLSLRETPAPVQAATQQDIDTSGALDLSDLLNRRLSGVNINENQENPFQPDLNYRGRERASGSRYRAAADELTNFASHENLR